MTRTTRRQRRALAQAVRQAPEHVAQPPPAVCLLVPLATALGALALYLPTLQTSLPSGDSGELITAAAVFGVAHPPGYPLFSMLGHAFTWLPFGNPAMRVNLMSALCQAAAAGIVTLITLGLLRSQRARVATVAALTAGLAFAFATPVWRNAVVAEVFALNNLLSALFLFLALLWARRPESTRLLVAAVFVFGLALSNHHTAVLLVPAVIALWFAARRPVPKGRQMTLVMGAFAAGLLPYAYLPIAAAQDPPLNWNDPTTLDRFLRQVSRADYGIVSLAGEQHPQGPVGEHIALYLGGVIESFTVAGCILAAAGAWWLWQRDRPLARAILLALLFAGPIFLLYARGPLDTPLMHGVIERFYQLPAIPFAVLFGAGAAAVLDWAERHHGSAAVPAAVFLLAVPLAGAAFRYPAVDQSSNQVAQHFAEDILSLVPANAILLTYGDNITFPLDYVQLAGRQREEVVLLDMEKLTFDWYVAGQKRRHPTVVFPFAVYDRGRTNSLRDLINVNQPARPVLVTTAPPSEPALLDEYDQIDLSFTIRLLPKGAGPTPAPSQIEKMLAVRYPDRAYPPSTWEAAMAKVYGGLAARAAFQLDNAARPQDAEAMYRKAMLLAPDDPTAYKNLGNLIRARDPNNAEIVSLWDRYLQINPTDPEAPAIRQEIARIRAIAR